MTNIQPTQACAKILKQFTAFYILCKFIVCGTVLEYSVTHLRPVAPLVQKSAIDPHHTNSEGNYVSVLCAWEGLHFAETVSKKLVKETESENRARLFTR